MCRDTVVVNVVTNAEALLKLGLAKLSFAVNFAFGDEEAVVKLHPGFICGLNEKRLIRRIECRFDIPVKETGPPWNIK